jgi:type II secretory pathway pseudopilin PulG
MTLVELLVGMALFGLIATLGVVQLRGGVRLWHAADARAAAIERIDAVHAVVRRVIEDAALLAEPDGTTAAFLAEPTRLRWVGRAPAGVMPPGLYALELALDGGALRLGWRAHDPARAITAQPPDETQVLLGNIASGTLQVFGTDAGGRTGWHADWQDAPRPPRLVRLDLVPDAAARWRWPPLVVAIGATVDPR